MPNRASGLRWTSSPGRDELVDAAIELADEDGLDGVSVRKLAARLNRRPMSIYTHVASKDDLVALMFDRISAELLLSGPTPTDGRQLLREIARRALITYLAHPWVLYAFGSRPPAGPNQLRRAEQSAQAVQALGVPETSAWTALSVLHEWTMGHALHLITLREDKALQRQLDGIDARDYPTLARALRSAPAPAASELALETVLDGIEQRLG